MQKLRRISSSDLTCQPHRGRQIRFHVVQVYGGSRPVPAAGTGWVPPLDVYETNDAYVIEVNLGGVEPDEVQLEFHDHVLHISGTRSEQGEPGMRCYHILEIERGNFARTLELPTTVEPRTVEAEFHHGLIVITVAKRKSGYIHGCDSAGSLEGLE
jgi:HSP20 family protein